MTVHRTNDRPSATQGNQRLLSHFLASLGVQEKTNCTSMLWSIESCQNRVSTDQYHLTVPRARVSTHRRRDFFWSYPLTNNQFIMIAGSSLFFPMIHLKYVVFMSLWPLTIKILISNWPRTLKSSQFFKNTGGEELFGYIMLWRKTFWLSKCDLCRIIYFILRGYDTYWFTAVIVFGRHDYCPLMQEHFFDLFWNVMLFIAAK